MSIHTFEFPVGHSTGSMEGPLVDSKKAIEQIGEQYGIEPRPGKPKAKIDALGDNVRISIRVPDDVDWKVNFACVGIPRRKWSS